MALSAESRKRLSIALTDFKSAGPEVADAIDLLLKSTPSLVADPGTGKPIPVDTSATINIVSAAAETNTLAIPTFIGQQLTLNMDTFAVGSRVITSAQGINQAGNTIMTFGAARDCIVLEAVTVGGALRWVVTANDGVALT